MTISSASEVDQYDENEGDWSDFDPEAWSRGEDYPEHLYEPVRLYDDVWELRPRTDLQELPKLDVPPESSRCETKSSGLRMKLTLF